MPKNNPEEFEYHCTECGAKVKASDKICPKCKADLSEEVDETNVKMVMLEYYQFDYDAEIVQHKLTHAGIESFISRDDGGGTRPNLGYTNGFRLMIKDTDFDKASKIIADKKTNDNYFETKCNYCGADVTLNKKEYDAGKYICPGCLKSNKLG